MTIRTDTKRKRFRGGTLALSLTAAALFGTAAQSGAQTTTTTETTRTQFTNNISGCTENVTVSFDETHKTQTQTGPNFVKISDTFHDQGTGTGVGTGAQYQFSSMSQNTVRSSSQTFYFRLSIRDHLIRNGPTAPGDDLFVVQTILVNVTNGHATFKAQDARSECK